MGEGGNCVGKFAEKFASFVGYGIFGLKSRAFTLFRFLLCLRSHSRLPSFPRYLREYSRRGTRVLHFVGTTLFVSCLTMLLHTSN